jgi:hypothetical protein
MLKRTLTAGTGFALKSREGLIPFTAKDTEAGQEAIYLSMMLGVPVPAWCK